MLQWMPPARSIRSSWGRRGTAVFLRGSLEKDSEISLAVVSMFGCLSWGGSVLCRGCLRSLWSMEHATWACQLIPELSFVLQAIPEQLILFPQAVHVLFLAHNELLRRLEPLAGLLVVLADLLVILDSFCTQISQLFIHGRGDFGTGAGNLPGWWSWGLGFLPAQSIELAKRQLLFNGGSVRIFISSHAEELVLELMVSCLCLQPGVFRDA